MKNENKVSAALLNDLSCGFGLAQAIKKNGIVSVKELQECASFRPALKDKLTQRFGRDWATTAAKVLNQKPVVSTPPKANTATIKDTDRDAIVAKLKELKIGFNPRTGTEKLQALLDNALAVASAPTKDDANKTDDNLIDDSKGSESGANEE